LPQPIFLETGQEFTFTIKRGVGTETCVSVNYDDFVNDVEAGDMLLVDGMWTFFVLLISDYLRLVRLDIIVYSMCGCSKSVYLKCSVLKFR
jgi:pyruvate kinase